MRRTRLASKVTIVMLCAMAACTLHLQSDLTTQISACDADASAIADLFRRPKASIDDADSATDGDASLDAGDE